MRRSVLSITILIVVSLTWLFLTSMGKGESSNDEEAVNHQSPAIEDSFRESILSRIVRVPAGSFTMGNSWTENQEMNDEGPPHPVSLDEFGIFTTEFTTKDTLTLLEIYSDRWILENKQILYKEGVLVLLDLNDRNSFFLIDEDGKLTLQEGKEHYPVNGITWYGAAFLCNILSELLGYEPVYLLPGNNISFNLGVRLPTEAQWEWSARSASEQTTVYPGELPLEQLAWFGEHNGTSPHPVGMKEPNSLGLYDMSGNVYEWCQDWYDFSYYSRSEEQNPLGSASGRDRVIRGGAFNDDAFALRIQYRFFRSPRAEQNYIGFRPVFP